ncbi:hypothetical protein ACDQ55_17300 [Chitinophaga sp. 30R24]|uniref:hypothetical protein n=1 Tax=Chitinophaga sp. 30R24 TaxID=3248838 RepID=UPI003B911974
MKYYQFIFCAAIMVCSCHERQLKENNPENVRESTKIVIDSNAVSKLDKATYRVEGDSVFLNFRGGSIQIEGSGVIPIQNDRNGEDSITLIDYDKNGVPEVIVMVDDPMMARRAHLKVFKLEDGILKQVCFNTGSQKFDELVVRNNICFIDSVGNIFAYTTNTMDKDDQLLMQIDKYSWDKKNGEFLYIKSKSILESNLPDSIKGLIF